MHEVKWIIDKRVILFRGVGDMTAESIREGVLRLEQFIEEGDAPIYLVNDGRYVRRFPLKIGILKDLATIGNGDKVGLIVRVGGDNVAKFVSQLLANFISGAKVHYTRTIEEAVEHVLALDDTLPQNFEYEEEYPAQGS